MSHRSLTGQQFREMLIEASNLLDMQSEQINSLNIFPVPDGDTGTNMNLTLKAAVNELQKENDNSIAKISAAAARGSLMGARGNSGVILSQIIRGIAQGLEGKNDASPIELAKALEKGVEIAYQAVMKPVEGTILTVAKDFAKAAALAAHRNTDIVGILEEAHHKGLNTLDRTPEMLPALKQAGVVDAGGKGLLIIYEGFLNILHQKQTTIEPTTTTTNINIGANISEAQTVGHFIYCTEFLIHANNISIDELKQQINDLGDSMLVVGADEMIKVHIHTNNPGMVLEFCLKLGSLHQIHINNMQEQMENVIKTKESVQKPFGVVAVVLGTGFKDIFTGLGVDELVDGGQTMNPSTEDLLKAVENVPADKVFLLPNNKNILLAAQQIPALTSKEIKVIPTKTIPQGISAMLSYEAANSFAVNNEKMLQNMDKLLTGEVTEAARDSKYGDFEIIDGDILGLNEEEIIAVGKNIKEVVSNLVTEMIGNSRELVTLYYGDNVNQKDADELINELTDQFPEIEFELHYGGQPHYFYTISVE